MKTSSWLSKSIKITAVLALATAAIGFANSANAVAFSYSSTPGSAINFPGDATFNFSPATNNFHVDSGTAVGFLGEMTGTFNIGTITNPFGNFFTAPVTGSGTFVIHDPADGDLTATLQWFNISQIGPFGFLNLTGQANLSNITYSGANADLVALAAANSGENVLSFTFTPAVDIHVLRDGPGPNSTSFSGTIAAVPDGGTTVMLLGAALGVLGMARRALKR